MRFSLLFAFFACVAFVFASDVLDLTQDDFDETLEKNDVILVEFFAPWCGHCKNLAPKYEKAATELKGVAALAKVDCTAQEAICQRFDVRGYPTLKVFREGKPSEYNGGREADAIVSFMKKQLMPAFTVLEAGTAKEFSASDKVVVLGFFKSDSDQGFKSFTEVAKMLRDEYVFGVTTDAAIITDFEVEAPAIVLFKKFDEGKNVFEGTFNKASISSFVKANAVPTMDDIGPANYQKFVDSGLPLAYLFVTEETRQSVGSIVEPVAKEFKGKMNFVYIDAVQYGGHASNLNLKVGDWPAFGIQNPKQNLKYPLTGEITAESVRALASGVLSGEVQPSIKSEPIPTEQGNVVVVVGKNYKDIMSQNKDVLIEFYAPWCGHCKKLIPIYDELGELYSDNENIVIAKMDATENDLPEGTPFQVQGFPTIKFIKADGSVVDYAGDRSLEDFQKFITLNATPRDEKAKAETFKEDL